MWFKMMAQCFIILTKEKVGQPVENAVIKGVVQQLQDGKKPGTSRCRICFRKWNHKVFGIYDFEQ